MAATATRGALLERKRIYILPTRHGLALALALAVMLAGSINYNNSLGYVLTFLLASLALVSMLHTHRNLAGLGVSGRDAEPVFAGGTARFHLRVDNRDGPERNGLVLRERRADDEPVVHVALAPDSAADAELPVAAPRRGWLALDAICIASRAPFGIFRAWSIAPVGLRTVVYPHPQGPLPLPPGTAEARDDRGRGGSGREDFSGLREYRSGDAPKRIHWKVAARTAVPPVKLFDGAVAADLWLHWRDAGGDDEARLSQLCAWVLEAEACGLRYGLELPGARVAPGSGPAHEDACLRRLALYRR